MAGNRQHILPKFLLKGFASRTVGKEIYTWVYRNDGKIYQSNISNAAVSKYFYGREGELSIDDNITKFEGEYAPLLDTVRINLDLTDVSKVTIAHLIAHLCTRTKHLRDSYRDSMEYFADVFRLYFSNHTNLKEAMLNEFLNRPGLIWGMIENELIRYPELKPYENILKIMYPKFIMYFLDSQRDENLALINNYFDKIKNNLPTWSRDGHIKGLSNTLIPKSRIDECLKLNWFLYSTEGPLILGDIGCLFEIKGTERFKSITLENDEIKNVFLPISDNLLLIGTSLYEIPSINLEVLNEEIAKCSREFFICARNNNILSQLSSTLGTNSEIITKDEIKNAFKKIIFDSKFKRFGIQN